MIRQVGRRGDGGRRDFRQVVLGLIIFALGVSWGFCASTTSSTPLAEGRALWVTRGQWKTPDDIRAIMENSAAMHFNIILFQVRGNGTVYYKSKLEPWAYELTSTSPLTTGKDPGWDPLQVAIDEAHKHGLKLHAWLNTFPGWQGQKYPPPEAHQLWTEHPDWFMVHKNGKKMIPRDQTVDPKTRTWYSFLNPAHPAVQEYVPKLYLEVIRNYDVDGIHFDYVRYPGEIDDFSYDPVSLARFKQETGKTPDEAPQEWTDWRAKQVATVVRKVYTEAKKIKPQVVIAGAVLANAPRARAKHFSRSQEWMREGIFDVAMLMNYHHGTEFTTQTQDFMAHRYGRHIYNGLSIGGGAAANARQSGGARGARSQANPAAPGDEDPTAVAQKSDEVTSDGVAVDGKPILLKEIEISRAEGCQGIAIFSYGSLVRNGKVNAQGRLLLNGPFAQVVPVPEMPWKAK